MVIEGMPTPYTKLLTVSSKKIGRRGCDGGGMEETVSCRFVISPAGTLGGAGARKYLGLGGRGGGRGVSGR